MASSRRQAIVDAPVETVWALIGDVSRHPEWWPRVEAVQCDLLAEGSTYRQVTKLPLERLETTMSIESLDDSHELRVRCMHTGLYAAFLLTPVQGGTFVDAELGVEPSGARRLVAGPFVRRWLDHSLEGLRQAAASAAGAHEQPRGERSQHAAG